VNIKPWYSHQLTRNELKEFVEKAQAGKSNDKAYIGENKSTRRLHLARPLT
jgi:hypothetical protein